MTHQPTQVTGRDVDGTPLSRHAPPGDVCDTCSDFTTGRLTPITQCPQAMAAYDNQELDRLRASGLMTRDEDPRHQ